MSRSCRRRPCASLPRRRASAADVAALREDIETLDRGLIEIGQAGDLALARASALGAVLAAHLSGSAPLALIPGGSA